MLSAFQDNDFVLIKSSRDGFVNHAKLAGALLGIKWNSVFLLISWVSLTNNQDHFLPRLSALVEQLHSGEK